ncbi:hypothetical protein KH017_08025 [bacterium]|nr:hypothetical protein [bacterium]
MRIHRYDADYRSTACLVVTAEFGYPAHELPVRYEICCYPGAPGVRTRLYVKGTVPFDPDLRPKHLIGAYTESLALPAGTFERIAFGYYSDTQHRCHRDLPILKEERASGPIGRGEVFNFANGLILCGKDGSAVLVKESHKCVNNSGVDTGEFILHADGVRVTGLGLAAAYEGPWFDDREFRGCWAGWCIVCSGGEAEAHRGLITAGIICGFAFCLIGVILILCNYDYALTGNYNLFLLSDYGYQLAKWFDKLFSILLYLVFCLGSIYVNVKLIRLSDLLLLSTRGKIAPGILRLIPVFFVFCLLAVVLTLLWFAHSPLFLYALTPLLVLLPVLFVAPVPEVVNVEVAERKIGEVLVDAVAFWLRSVLKFLPLIWIGASFASLCSFSHHGVQPYFLLFLPPLLVINILLNFLVLELLKGILSIPDKLDALKKDAR